jgi:hypothetical protein
MRSNRATHGMSCAPSAFAAATGSREPSPSVRPEQSMPPAPSLQNAPPPGSRPMLHFRRKPSFSSPVWYSRVVLHVNHSCAIHAPENRKGPQMRTFSE